MFIGFRFLKKIFLIVIEVNISNVTKAVHFTLFQQLIIRLWFFSPIGELKLLQKMFCTAE